MKNILKLFLFVAITLVFVRCSLPATITSQYDEVLNVELHRYNTAFSKNERQEQVYWQNISLVKERNMNGEINYTMYDVITMPHSSFNLSDKMYIVIDKKVTELTNTSMEKNAYSRLNKSTESIMKADSSKVDVVTDYSEQQLKTYKMTHPINSEIIQQILGANDIYLRYYAGPNLITSEIKSYKLAALKRMIQKENRK